MEDHKRRVEKIFDLAALQYGMNSSSFFNYFGKHLVEQADVRPHQHILDVATGRGAILFPLAEAVGPLGKVFGVDISRQMLKETEKEAKKRKIHWVDFQWMDAEQLKFSDHSFDAVFCGFALFFFPSVQTALREFRRVLKPGGTLGVSIWGKRPELNAWFHEETKKLGSTSNLVATPLEEGRDLRKVLEEALFQEIQIFEESKKFVYNTAEEWWNSLWGHGARAKLEDLSSAQIEVLHKKALAKASQLGDGKEIAEERQVFYGIAKT